MDDDSALDEAPYYELHRQNGVSSLLSVTEQKPGAPVEVMAVTNPEAKLCVVCVRQRKSMAFIPCSHLCVCEACSELLLLCPVCRQEIAMTVRVAV
eukprot:NODE_1839_length_740_cov_277.244573_g1431_i0.p3 GENE.NODE_1839_length_740_cov_277.244573_g1431_i0~~NODE_1839_length_740_cov_277.244573_g1431_i0.p3  ORF type:complete len:96 (+),score=16.19 NODE_1839_length_740_cov_277.244573_g1431_i0:400-687(+)